MFAALLCWVAANPAYGEVSEPTSSQMRELLETLSGESAHDYMTFDFGRERDPAAVSVVVARERGLELVSELREQLQEGRIAFVGTDRWLGDEVHDGKVEVVVAAGADQFDILRLARTDAVNHDMLTDDLIAWFEANESEITVEILQASTDTIFATVLQGPEDMDAFVDKLYAFCPDIVDQGSGSKDDLRGMLAEHRMLYLWWD